MEIGRSRSKRSGFNFFLRVLSRTAMVDELIHSPKSFLHFSLGSRNTSTEEHRMEHWRLVGRDLGRGAIRAGGKKSVAKTTAAYAVAVHTNTR